MRFIVDAQLPPALARWLDSMGAQAEHVVDVGLESAVDTDVWAFATEVSATIVTKDQDFALRRAFSPAGPSVVWIRTGNTSRRELLAWFENVYPMILAALEQGETLIEVV